MVDNPVPIRFTMRALPGITFLRYPASVAPNEGTIGFVTDGKAWQTGGVYRDGRWRNMRGKPFDREINFWTVMEATDGQD